MGERIGRHIPGLGPHDADCLRDIRLRDLLPKFILNLYDEDRAHDRLTLAGTILLPSVPIALPSPNSRPQHRHIGGLFIAGVVERDDFLEETRSADVFRFYVD